MNTQPPLAQVSVSDGEISMEPLTLNAGVSGLYSAYRMFLLFFFFWHRLKSIVQKTSKLKIREDHPCFPISLPRPRAVPVVV